MVGFVIMATVVLMAIGAAAYFKYRDNEGSKAQKQTFGALYPFIPPYSPSIIGPFTLPPPETACSGFPNFNPLLSREGGSFFLPSIQ